MKLKPLSDRVVIVPEKAPEVSKGGIVLAPRTQAMEQRGVDRGIVAAVGPGKLSSETGKRLPMTLQVGDMVRFALMTGVRIKDDDDTDFVIVSESEVLAVEESDAQNETHKEPAKTSQSGKK